MMKRMCVAGLRIDLSLLQDKVMATGVMVVAEEDDFTPSRKILVTPSL